MKNSDGNYPRKSDEDVFLAKKLKDANFNTGFYQIPEINDVDINKPAGLVLWSNRHRCKDKKNHGLYSTNMIVSLMARMGYTTS